MPPKLLVDISDIDLDKVEYSIEAIRELNPQRYEFEQLTAVLAFRPEEKIAIGLRKIREDEFWVRGHVPGRPLLPGVLMIEAAAQLSSFYTTKTFGDQDALFGLGGIDKARFRGTVLPGQDLILLARPEVLTPSRSLFATQGVVDGKVVFDANILGVRLR